MLPHENEVERQDLKTFYRQDSSRFFLRINAIEISDIKIIPAMIINERTV